MKTLNDFEKKNTIKVLEDAFGCVYSDSSRVIDALSTVFVTIPDISVRVRVADLISGICKLDTPLKKQIFVRDNKIVFDFVLGKFKES